MKNLFRKGYFFASVGFFVLYGSVQADPSSRIIKDLTFPSGFSKIVISGRWQVDLQVKPKDTFHLRADISKERVNSIVIKRSFGVLYLRFANKNLKIDPVKVVISAPSLRNIFLIGENSLDISEFYGNSLRLDVKGKNQIHIKQVSKLRIENLYLKGCGKNQIDLQGVVIKNLSLQLCGQNDVTGIISGGKLRVDASGLNSLTYSGTPSNEEIKSTGLMIHTTNNNNI